MAETTLESPATVHRMTPFLAKFVVEGVLRGPLFSAYILFNDDLFGMVLVGREVNNSNSGILNMIWSVSDGIIVRLDDGTQGGRGKGR